MESKYQCLLLTLALTSALLAEAHGKYVNDYDYPFYHICPGRQFLSSVRSTHDNGKEDRIFTLSCRTLPTHGTPVNCQWSDFTNNFDELQVFQCPRNGYIAGMGSYHSNHHEDRRYKFYCCELRDQYVINCMYTPWQNSFDEHVSYRVSYGMILRGMISYHSNHHEDRRFKFNVCRLTKLFHGCILPA